MKSCFIGLDLGTSSVKAGLYDMEGHELSVARASLALSSPEPGWAEQDPYEWIRAVQSVLSNLVVRSKESIIQAIGLCGQCPGHVLVGDDRQPIGPAIIWRDRRATVEAAWLASRVSRDSAVEWVGSPALGDATMPPARLLWLKNHRPNAWSKAAAILQPKDFIGLYLTGTISSDIHTSFMLSNPHTRRIHPDFLNLLGTREDKFAPVRQVTDLLGNITPATAVATGIPAGTPVIVGTIDAYCEILAAGGFIPGQGVDVAGTSEMIALGVDRPYQSSSVFSDELEGAGMFLCGPTHSGCGLQDWLVKVIYSEMSGLVDLVRLEGEAAAISPGANGLVFLPYIYGERAPIWDAHATGAFLGITAKHDRRHFARAMYESVGFVIRHVFEACTQVSGIEVSSVVTCGGGSRSKFWNQIKADVLQKPVHPLQAQASACLGAAMLAATGCGVFPRLADASAGMCLGAAVFKPDPDLAALYDEKYLFFRQIYPVLHSLQRSE